MSIDKLKTIERSIEKLKSKGVTAIKIELEANLDRGSSEAYCNYCDEGRVDCGNGCWWSYEQDRAVVNCPECIEEPDSDCELCESTREVMCPDCHGDGRVDCDDCDGTGEARSSDDYSDPAVCKEYIFDRLADITGTERLSPEPYDPEEYNPFDWVKFARFYYDGSVDSEITLTIPLTKEAVMRLPAVVQAFKDLGDEIGNGIDTRGAGMHMALLFTEDCSYPDVAAEYTQDYIDRFRAENYYSSDFPETSTRLPENMLRNFQKSMTQLLPALYFLGSPDATSRGLRYRMPTVSIGGGGNSQKYSAIVYRLGSFEFRVFETCYDSPDTVLDNVAIMANSMRYLSDKYISPGVDKVAKRIKFGSDQDNTIGRFYKTAEHLDALNIGLQRLKPDYYTIKQLKEARGFKYTKAHANNESKRITALAEKAYEEYSLRYDFATKLRTEAYARGRLADRINTMSLEELTGLEPSQMLEEYLEQEEQRREQKQDRASYIKQVYDNNMYHIVGQYTLEFN